MCYNAGSSERFELIETYHNPNAKIRAHNINTNTNDFYFIDYAAAQNIAFES